MDDQRAQILEKIKASSNFLVTVSSNPNVDQLAAAIGLTLVLGKLGKQATAVFSGEVPSTLRFLRPEKTLQKNPDSLQDFIISLDKAKADKLRYKVEDDVVRIFITPYKTSLSSKDLTYSKGDFNVDLVLALGVARKEDLDTAIAAHGRILHDATVISVTNTDHAQLGTLHLEDTGMSGLSEMVVNLARDLGADLLDDQIATALLTGIVASTDFFGNDKTTPMTLTASADLLEAGANQQLVSTELGGPKDREGDRPGQRSQGGQGQRDPASQLKSYKQIAQEHGKDRPAGSLQPGGAGQQSVGQPQSQRSTGPRPGEATEPRQVSPTKELPAVVQHPTEAAPKAAPPKPEDMPAVLDRPTSVVNLPPPPIAPVSETTQKSADTQGPSVIALPPAEKSPAEDLATTTPTPTPMLDTDKTLADIEAKVKYDQDIENSTDVDSARKAVESALGASSGPPADMHAQFSASVEPAALANVPDDAPGAPTPVPSPASVPAPDLPDFLKTPSMASASAPPAAPPLPPTLSAPQPAGPQPSLSLTPPAPPAAPTEQPRPAQPHNPAVNEQAPLSMSPADQPFTMPLPQPPAAPSTTIASDELPPALQGSAVAGPPPGPPPMPSVPPIPPSMPPPGPGAPGPFQR